MEENMDWRQLALCATSAIDFHSEDPEEIAEALDLCAQCPVRKECLQTALDNQDRFGVWGGTDEETRRLVLSVDHYGKPIRNSDNVPCPYCDSEDITVLSRKRTKTHLQCSECGVNWWSKRVLAPVIPIEQSDVDFFDTEE